MSAEDGEGENPYRPRRVGPPGPGYNTKPPSRWRRSKSPKPPKRSKQAETAPPLAANPPQAPPPPPVEQSPGEAPPAPPAAPQPSSTPPPAPPPAEQPPPQVQPPLPDESQSPAESPPKRKGRKIDYLVGIPLGLLLGVGIVTAFVFLGSEGTIDAPRIKNPGNTGVTGETGATGASEPGQSASPSRPPTSSSSSPKPPAPAKLPVIRIEGSNPPLAAGPVKIEATRGKPVKFRIESDGTVSIEILGTGFTKVVSSGDTVTFTPQKAGQFPTLVSGNDVNVATFDVSP